MRETDLTDDVRMLVSLLLASDVSTALLVSAVGSDTTSVVLIGPSVPDEAVAELAKLSDFALTRMREVSVCLARKVGSCALVERAELSGGEIRSMTLLLDQGRGRVVLKEETANRACELLRAFLDGLSASRSPHTVGAGGYHHPPQARRRSS